MEKFISLIKMVSGKERNSMKKKYVMVLLAAALMTGTVSQQAYAAEETYGIQETMEEEPDLSDATLEESEIAVDETEKEPGTTGGETEEASETTVEETQEEPEITVDETEEEPETTVEEAQEEPETAADEEPEKEEDTAEESTIDESQEQETELNEEAEASVEETYTQNGWDEWGSYYENGTKVKSDWRKIGGYWYWFDSYGYKVTDNNNYYVTKDDAYYAFDAQGHMRKGWVQDDSGDWYYCGDSGKMLQSAWAKLGNYWYYFDSSRRMIRNDMGYYISKKDAYYCFDKKGHMMTGWQQEENGDWYYFANSGKRLENQWLQKGKYWYYLGGDGIMLRNVDDHYIVKNNATYAFDAKGHMVTGWLQNKYGDWYYFNNNGKRVESQWIKSGKNWYYFDEYGTMLKDYVYYYIAKNNAKYSFDGAGHMRKGWVQDNDGNWYYFDKNGKGIHTQWMKSGKYWYYLDDDGMAVSGYIYYYVAQNNAKYSFDESGHMRKGWVQGNNGEWYYFGKNGKMLVNQWMQLGDNLYYFMYNGQMATGYCVINEELHYFNNGGIWQRQLS